MATTLRPEHVFTGKPLQLAKASAADDTAAIKSPRGVAKAS